MRCFSGRSHQLLRSLSTNGIVRLERLLDLVHVFNMAHQRAQDIRIFDGHTSTRALMWTRSAGSVSQDGYVALVVCPGRWIVKQGPDVSVLHHTNDLLDNVAPGFEVFVQVLLVGVDHPVWIVPRLAAVESDDCK